MNNEITVNHQELNDCLSRLAGLLKDHESFKDANESERAYMRGVFACMQVLHIDCAGRGEETTCFASWIDED